MSTETRPETEFYQITGYRAHSNGWFKMYDDKPTTEAIINTELKIFRPGGKDSPVELVLGILPSGASYLLMTHEQMLEFTHRHRLQIPRKPWRSADFLSLSPIYFSSPRELTAKVATYKQRPRNKNRRESGEEPLDNSQANRGYVQTGQNVVHYRAYFEHQRTLCRLLTRDLVPGKVGLFQPSWLDCVRVVSLVIGEWTFDKRRRDDRLKEPELIDIGWTDALFPSFFEQLEGSTVHFKLKGKKLSNSSRKPFFSEVVEDDRAGLDSKLRKLFDHDVYKSGIPLIVLAHDEEMARGVLAHAGIQVDSWPSGLSKLLPLASAESRYSIDLPGPCVVDTQKLVKVLMETEPGRTVPQSAKVLRVQTDDKVCAGDDSLLQLHMWMSMAQGLAIDEQRTERSSRQPDCAQLLAPPPPPPDQQQQQGNANVNVDPNDIDPNDMPPVEPRPAIIDDFSDEDDW